MERKNSSEEFIKMIFERSNDPFAQLERIYKIVPGFYADGENVKQINKHLDALGYQVNEEFIDAITEKEKMYAHPSCGNSNGYGNGYGHPSCGNSGYGYGYGHPSCGNSNGYGNGYGHPSCGNSGYGYGYGHPSCHNFQGNKGKTLLLVKKDRVANNEIRN